MILIVGDSFTYGEELKNRNLAWPFLLNAEVINLAMPGYSNDAIIRSVVNLVETTEVNQTIIAWTTPHRIEVNNKHLTPTSYRRYGSICTQIFSDWDSEWAINKFHSQVSLLTGYLSSKNIKYLFVKTFDVPESKVGHWADGSIIEWMGDCPKGPWGHPLELGHQRIAERIYEHIRHLGWVS